MNKITNTILLFFILCQQALAEIEVDVVSVKASSLYEHRRYTSTVEYREIASLPAHIDGFLSHIVEAGTQVDKGELLATIQSPSLDSKIIIAESELKGLRSEKEYLENKLASFQSLLDNNGISRDSVLVAKRDLTRTEVEIQKKQALLVSLKKDKSFSFIHAPFSGVIIKRFVNPHEAVKKYDPVLTILNPNETLLLAKLPVEVGETLSEYYFDENLTQNDFDKRERILSFYFSEESGVRFINVKLKNSSRANIGETVRVFLPARKYDKVFLVPKSSLIQGAQGHMVASVSHEGIVTIDSANILFEAGESVAVDVEGWSEAESVVVENGYLLASGQKVLISNKVLKSSSEG